jgi:hypothetical protein
MTNLITFLLNGKGDVFAVGIDLPNQCALLDRLVANQNTR